MQYLHWDCDTARAENAVEDKVHEFKTCRLTGGVFPLCSGCCLNCEPHSPSSSRDTRLFARHKCLIIRTHVLPKRNQVQTVHVYTPVQLAEQRTGISYTCVSDHHVLHAIARSGVLVCSVPISSHGQENSRGNKCGKCVRDCLPISAP